MNPCLSRVAFCATLLVLTSADAYARQASRFLQLDRYELEAGSDVVLHFEDELGGMRTHAGWPTGFDWLFVRVRGGQTNLRDVRPDDAGKAAGEGKGSEGDVATLRLSEAGITLLAADAHPRVETLSARAWSTWTAARLGPDHAPSPPGAEPGPVRVRRLESTKALARVLGADGWRPNSATAQSKTGQRAEIRPLADPTSVRVKADLPLRIYLPVEQRSGTKVIARHVASSREQSFLTDGGGTGFFTVSLSGLWTIEAHSAHPLEDDPDADWEVFSATLVFEVPHLDPREGAPRGSEGEEREGRAAMSRRTLPSLAPLVTSLAVLAAHALGAAPHLAQQTRLLQPRWRELGPAPIESASYAGRVSAIVCSPTDPSRYFVGGADSGVWRSTDAGASWTNLTDALPSSAIGALALDPDDENVIYAGTGEANYANHSRYGLGIYKSTDGGESWAHLARSTFEGRCFSRIVVDPHDSSRVFAGVTRAGGFPELAAAKGHPMATGAVGVFRSEDGGATWTQLPLPNLSATDVAVDPATPDVVYAAIGRIFGDASNGIYKSTDGGEHWTKLAGGLPASTDMGRISVAIAPSNPARLYAMITADATSSGGNAATLGTYRSDDGGATWTQLPLGNIQVTYGWYLCVVGVHPSDDDLAFWGGLSFHRTRNAGVTFATVTPPHVDMHAVAWDAAGRMLVGDDGGVHRSTDDGDSWVPLNAGLGTVQFYAGLSTHPTDDRVVLGGTQDNGSNQREAAGLGWNQVFGGDGGWTQIDQSSPNRRFVEYQGTGNLFVTDNSGASFTYTGTGISGADRNCFLPPYLIDPTDSSRMYYATHRVYRSGDSGVSWTAVSGDLTTGLGAIRSMALAPSNPDVLYVATNDGNVQVSDDAGDTFSPSLTDRPGWPRVTREICVHPDDPSTAYLATSAFGVDQVHVTTNMGVSWTPIDQGLPDLPINTVAVLPARLGRPERVFAGSDSGLFVTTDGGATWNRFGIGLPGAPVIDILLEPARNRITVGTQGRGAWQAALDPKPALPLRDR